MLNSLRNGYFSWFETSVVFMTTHTLVGESTDGFILVCPIAAAFEAAVCQRDLSCDGWLHGFVYFFFLSARSATCFADELASAEAFIALGGDYACSITDVALHHSLLSGQLSRAFALVAF
jgi:hypothetical protein